MTWRHWLYGLLGAFYGAFTTSLANIVIDPVGYNVHTLTGWAHIGEAAFVAGFVAAVLYLKTSPIPLAETTTTVTATTKVTETVTPKGQSETLPTPKAPDAPKS